MDNPPMDSMDLLRLWAWLVFAYCAVLGIQGLRQMLHDVLEHRRLMKGGGK